MGYIRQLLVLPIAIRPECRIRRDQVLVFDAPDACPIGTVYVTIMHADPG